MAVLKCSWQARVAQFLWGGEPPVSDASGFILPGDTETNQE